MKTHLVVAVAGMVFGLFLGVAPAHGAEDHIEVWVGILPQVEMVERIGGEHVAAHSLVQPGDSPTTYETTPKQLAALWQADLYLAIGVPFEGPLLLKLEAMYLEIPIASVFEDIDRLPMVDHHGHGAAGSPDPHIWLDPELVKVQATAVRRQLCEIAPIRCAEFNKNLEDYLHDVDAVERRMDDVLRPYRDRELFVFHPSFGYLARRYGLHQVAVEVDGKQPSPRQLADLVERVHGSNTRAIFVQPQIADRAAQAVAVASGCTLVELDPLAADHLANLERMAQLIAASYGD